MSHIHGTRNERGGLAGSNRDAWWVVEPPLLTPAELLADLRDRWCGEFDGASVTRKIGFTALRLVQHAAYRLGYGRDRVRAIELPGRGRSFQTMERNLEDVEEEHRLHLLQGFLARVNRGEGDGVGLPQSVVFELSRTCNFNCIGCGVGADGVRRDRFMALSSLRRYAQSLCRNGPQVRINGLGEATLHPHFEACVEVLADYPGGREVISNFSAPREIYGRLLEMGFVVLVSWDAASEAAFRAIRRGADFEELSAKLPWVAERAAARQSTPLVLLFTLRPENVGELVATVEMAAKRGVRRFTVNVFMRPDHVDWTLERRSEVVAAFDEAAEAADRLGVELVLPDHLGEMRVASAHAHRCSASGCGFPWSQVVVRWNGDLTPCNMMNPYCYGNIDDRGLEGAWNGPEAGCFRDNANTANRHQWCRGCYYVDPQRKPVS